MREVYRRPGEPLRVHLERGRDHPIDREKRDYGPDREHEVTHDRRHSPPLRFPHHPAGPCPAPAYIVSSDLFSRRSSRIANSTMTIISSMTMYDIAAPFEI